MAWINIEVNLDEIATDDLIDELEDRGYCISDSRKTSADETDVILELNRIVQMHRIGDPRWEPEALELMYSMVGKIV